MFTQLKCVLRDVGKSEDTSLSSHDRYMGGLAGLGRSSAAELTVKVGTSICSRLALSQRRIRQLNILAASGLLLCVPDTKLMKVKCNKPIKAVSKDLYVVVLIMISLNWVARYYQ